MIRHLLLFSLTVLLIACETTPYDVKPDYCQGLTMQSNRDKLKQIELQTPNKKSFKVALTGDPQANPLSMQQVVAEINKRHDIDFVMVLGDLSDTGLEQEFDWVCASLKKLKQPFFAVVGNHDVISNGKTIWARNFGPFNYSFSYLGTKFLAYNDNGYEFEDVPDMQFIKAEAKVLPGETRHHTIAASHIPPWVDVHNQDHVDRFLKTLNELNIEHTVHGHRHDFFFEKDIHGNQHYVVGNTKGVEWGVMTITPSQIVMENCKGSICTEVTVQ